jgi:hypothetical protein
MPLNSMPAFFSEGLKATMNGGVSAEQKHSGIVAYLGKGSAFAFLANDPHLLRRQQNLDKMHQQKEDDQYVRAPRHASTYREPNSTVSSFVPSSAIHIFVGLVTCG